MEITEVRIKMAEGNDERLRAFCSITIDNCFVVRDIKIIDGPTGLFVAMPARQSTINCRNCRSKNLTRSHYCGHCGRKLERDGERDPNEKLYADIAHPINAACRDMIQSRILAAFRVEQAALEETKTSPTAGPVLIIDDVDPQHSSRRPYVVASDIKPSSGNRTEAVP